MLSGRSVLPSVGRPRNGLSQASFIKAFLTPCSAVFHSQNIFLLRQFSTSQACFKSKRRAGPVSQSFMRAQMEQKRLQNIARIRNLQRKRREEAGDPVRGIITPFVNAFRFEDSAPSDAQTEATENSKDAPPTHTSIGEKVYKYSLTESELKDQLEQSKALSTGKFGEDGDASEMTASADADHAVAAEAVARILSLEDGSGKDKLRANIRRCVDTFGRHHTDPEFLPKIRAQFENSSSWKTTPGKVSLPRVGPDTGSSEVQIAILTAKIHNLADFLEKRGKKDKHNKRNLRLLVHRRQKLLRYLRRKERGGPRWQHCIETLGLGEGTWKGEISL